MKCGYRSLLLLALALPFLQTAPDAFARTAMSLSSAQIALQPKDVPNGFKQVQSGYLKNDQMSKNFHMSVTMMKRSGLTTTYETAFLQPQAGIFISDVIDHFNSPDAAQLSYRRLSQLGGTAFRANHPRNLPSNGLGPEARGIMYNWLSKGVTLSTMSLLFRQGSYVAIVVVTARPNAVKQSATVHFAQIVEQRMKQAG